MRTPSYLLIISLITTALAVTTNIQAGPLNHASELTSQNIEQKKIRLAGQENVKSRKAKKDARQHVGKKRINTKDRRHENRDQNKHSQGMGYRDNKYRKYGKSHKRNSYYRGYQQRKLEHGRRNPGWVQEYNYYSQPSFSQPSYSPSSYSPSSFDWRYAGEFQTRRHEKRSDIQIEVNGYIDVVELEGLGRGTVIYNAYVETEDGRLKRLRDLEGYIERGDYLRQELRHKKYVRVLHLEVASSGRKRAYAKINVGKYTH